MTALYGMGMMFASVFLASGREAWHLANLMQKTDVSGLRFLLPGQSAGGARRHRRVVCR